MLFQQRGFPHAFGPFNANDPCAPVDSIVQVSLKVEAHLGNHTVGISIKNFRIDVHSTLDLTPQRYKTIFKYGNLDRKKYLDSVFINKMFSWSLKKKSLYLHR